MLKSPTALFAYTVLAAVVLYGFFFLAAGIPLAESIPVPKTLFFQRMGGPDFQRLGRQHNATLAGLFVVSQVIFFRPGVRRMLRADIGGPLHALVLAVPLAILMAWWDVESQGTFWYLGYALGGTLRWAFLLVQVVAWTLVVKNLVRLALLAARAADDGGASTPSDEAVRAAVDRAREQDAAVLNLCVGLFVILFGSVYVDFGRFILGVAAFTFGVVVIGKNLGTSAHDLSKEVTDRARALRLFSKRRAPLSRVESPVASHHPAPLESDALPPPPREGPCPHALRRGATRLLDLWLGLFLLAAALLAYWLFEVRGVRMRELRATLATASRSESEWGTFLTFAAIVLALLAALILFVRCLRRLREVRLMYRRGVLIQGSVGDVQPIKGLDYWVSVVYRDAWGAWREGVVRGVGKPEGRISVLLSPARDDRVGIYIPARPALGSNKALFAIGRARKIAGEPPAPGMASGSS